MSVFRNICCCCVANPPDQFLNYPVVTVSTKLGGLADIPAALQPYDYCGYGPGGGCGHPSNWREFCGNPYDPTDPTTAAAAIPCGGAGGPGVIGRNVFTSNPDYKVVKQCQYPGWKGVAAAGVWPGMFGFVQTGCCGTSPNFSASPQTKYTSMTTTIDCTVTGHAARTLELDSAGNSYPSDYYTMDWSSNFHSTQTASVDQYGNVSNSGSASSGTTANYQQPDSSPPINWQYDVSSNACTQAFSINFQKWSVPNGLHLLDAIPNIQAGCGIIGITFVPGVDEFSGDIDQCNAWLAAKSAALNAQYYDSTDQQPAYGTYSETKASCNVQWQLTIADNALVLIGSGTATQKIRENLVVGSPQELDSESGGSFTLKITMSLGGSFSFASALADAEAIAACWPLGDDTVYPWRTDGEVWRVPLVTRDAQGSAPMFSSGTVTPPFTDPGLDSNNNETYHHLGIVAYTNVKNFTGAIRGAPQPVGYARYFNFSQPVQIPCPGDVIEQDNNWFCLSGWGELSPDVLPKTATQWTDEQLGTVLMEGAWIMQNGTGSDGKSVYIQKWAETKMAWPSVNFARPFGRDRFTVNYPAVTGDSDCAGTTGVSTENFKEICLDPTDAPNWNHRRFPTCPPIGSTINLVSVSYNGSGTLTFTTAEPHWLMAGGTFPTPDVIDIYNVPGLGAGVTLATATPNTNTFTVAGSLASTYTSGGYIAAAGTTSTNAKWDYTCSRNSFITQTWLLTLRADGGYAYTQTQGSLVPLAGFSILYCSPNAETFPATCATCAAPWGSITYEACTAYWRNGVFGNTWNCKFLQAVNDPFFLAPTQCSGETGSGVFAQQQSPCTDGPATAGSHAVTYFKFPPLVEPMIQMPANAPGLQVAWNTNFDGGIPQNCAVPGSDPASHPQIQTVYTAFMACADWQAAVHQHCNFTPNLLPDAGGYMSAPGGDPATSSGGAGDAGGGAGDSSGPGAGDSSGGLF